MHCSPILQWAHLVAIQVEWVQYFSYCCGTQCCKVMTKSFKGTWSETSAVKQTFSWHCYVQVLWQAGRWPKHKGLNWRRQLYCTLARLLNTKVRNKKPGPHKTQQCGMMWQWQRKTQGLNTESITRELDTGGKHSFDYSDKMRPGGSKREYTKHRTRDCQRKTGNTQIWRRGEGHASLMLQTDMGT